MTQIHEWPVRVYYEDTDAEGVVYFANYLKFVERARTEWLRALGLEQDELRREHGVVFTVSETWARFVCPARFNDLLQVRTRLVEQGRVRFTLVQDIWRGEQLLAETRCVAACVDVTGFKPRRLPERLHAALAATEPDED